MRKEIIDCINNKIKKTDEERQSLEAIRKQQEKLDNLEKDRLIPIIKDFFKDLPSNGSYRIVLVVPNNKDNPQQVTKGLGYSTYPTYIHIKPSLEPIGYDNIDISKHYGLLKIEGFNFTNEYRHYDYQYLGRESDHHYTMWKVSQLKAFIENLGWFEEQIAKEYGCLKE